MKFFVLNKPHAHHKNRHQGNFHSHSSTHGHAHSSSHSVGHKSSHPSRTGSKTSHNKSSEHQGTSNCDARHGHSDRQSHQSLDKLGEHNSDYHLALKSTLELVPVFKLIAAPISILDKASSKISYLFQTTALISCHKMALALELCTSYQHQAKLYASSNTERAFKKLYFAYCDKNDSEKHRRSALRFLLKSCF